MARVVNAGPNGTAVGGVAAITLAIPPLNYTADFLPVALEAGASVYTDKTSPTDRPSTIRLATRDVANVYAGSTIDPTAYLPNKRGRDIVVQCQEIHSITDAADTDLLLMYPIKATLTINTPINASIDAVVLKRMVTRTLAAIARQGMDTLDTGLEGLLRGVTTK